MDINLIAKEKNSIELEFIDVDDVDVLMLVQELNNDKKVDNVIYHRGHPMLEKPKIMVEVNEGKPQTAIKKAARQISREYKGARELFIKLSK